ncbi:MAG: hypothetical protein ACJ8KU_02305 [Chthoniobacterales bacterium]
MKCLLVCLFAVVAITACHSPAPSDDWRRGKTYRKIEPRTGSLVPRYVAVEDGSEAPTHKPKPKKAKKAPAKRESVEDLTPAPPEDRFR